MYEPNITCRRCRHRHPASLNCEEARARAEAGWKERAEYLSRIEEAAQAALRLSRASRDRPKVYRSARVRRGFSWVLKVVEPVFHEVRAERGTISAAERREIALALAWLRQEAGRVNARGGR